MGGLDACVRRWNTALRVVVATAVVAAVGFAGIPAADAAAAGATLSVSHSWQDGFIAHFSITNSSAAPLNDWKLEFDMPAGQSISHMWNGTYAQYGTHWVVSPANWNRTIAPGASATGGFRGVLTGTYSPPLNCQLNRQYLCS
jgi:cellulase/cellobiase CelA1